MLVGIFSGIFLLLVITSWISGTERHMSWLLSNEFEGYDWIQAYNIRGVYLNEQASALITAPDFNLRANYRMIIFEESGKILICADSGADLSTGFIFPTSKGLKTLLPSNPDIIFQVYKICSIRI